MVFDDEGESSRERLGIACGNVAARRLLWLCLAPHTFSSDAKLLSQSNSGSSERVYEAFEDSVYI